MLGVGFRGFRSVMLGMHSMAVRCHCMVRSLFSCSGFVVFGRFVVVFRGRLMMLGCALMMLCNFSSHRIFLLNLSMLEQTRCLLEISMRPGSITPYTLFL